MERHRFLDEAMKSIRGQDEAGGKNGQRSVHRGYLSRVVRGVVERAIELDARIDAVSSMKVKRMHPVVRNTLRLGAYEILYMDSIPASASVNECVRLLQKQGQYRAKGLANAVLRRIAETKKEPVGNREMSALGISALDENLLPQTAYSMPPWIYNLWSDRFGGEKARAICAAFLRERPLSLRVNETFIRTEELAEQFRESGIMAEPAREIPTALSLQNVPAVESLPGYAEGYFYIQDIGAIEVVREAGLKPGERVLDVCAAPGGKALHAADIVGVNGFVEARDISEEKVARIRENGDRCRFPWLKTQVWDATKRDEGSEAAFDVVIADVPCSGLGVLGRKPEIKYRVKPEDIDELCRLQRQILECVCGYVKPNGRLVYATCTINEPENEGQIREFLAVHPAFTKMKERQIFPDEIELGNDGFYVCVMCRIT